VTLRICFVQHTEGEGPGALERWALDRGHGLTGIHPYRGDRFPAPTEFDLLVVLGGAMNVVDVDRHPWLAEEKDFLWRAIEHGGPILGICLGSQLLAEALGARVRRNPEPEIGWFTVTRTAADSSAFGRFPPQAEVFHWHEHTWDVPPGAVCLAGSAACPGQAFAYQDRIVGLQFHPEMTPEIARFMAASEGDTFPSGAFVQTPEEILADGNRFEAGNALLYDVLDQLATRAAAIA
jgi:GMP synthase-like glutamine amidotransferase